MGGKPEQPRIRKASQMANNVYAVSVFWTMDTPSIAWRTVRENATAALEAVKSVIRLADSQPLDLSLICELCYSVSRQIMQRQGVR